MRTSSDWSGAQATEEGNPQAKAAPLNETTALSLARTALAALKENISERRNESETAKAKDSNCPHRTPERLF